MMAIKGLSPAICVTLNRPRRCPALAQRLLPTLLGANVITKFLPILMMVGLWSGCGGDKGGPTVSNQEITKAPDGTLLEVKTTEWDNGNIKEEFQYFRDGGAIVKHGWQKEYDENGELIDVDSYLNGLCYEDCEWSKKYDAYLFDSLRQTADGGFIIAGSDCTVDDDCNDLLLLKFDVGGNEEWKRSFTNYGDGQSIEETTDGGFIVVGNDNDVGAWLLKTDAQGIEEWKQANFDMPEEIDQNRDIILESVVQAIDGGFIATGHKQIERNRSSDETDDGFDPISNSLGLFLFKADQKGNEVWRKNMGEGYGRSIVQTTDGGFIVCGESWNWHGGGFKLLVWLLKIDDEGNEIWSKAYGDGVPFSVQETVDRGFITTGSSSGGILLLKVDEQGNEVWKRNFVGVDNRLMDIGASVKQAVDGGFIIVGSVRVSDMLMLKTDGNGAEEWRKYWGEGSGWLTDVEETVNGGFAVIGYNDDEEKAVFMKTDSTGELHQ